MDPDISKLADDVERLRTSDRTTPEAEEEAREHLDEVRQEYEQLRGDSAYRQHVLRYIQEERESFQDGEREKPLCGCRIRCPVKRGRIPARVRKADSIEEGIHAYQERHSEAIVLLEAKEDWIEKKARVRKALSDAKAALKRSNWNEREQPNPS
ncbi:hypothetical protein [Halosimplex pelagicum]|uniref:Uncharacterized protein n=1 Tax=Halosimplex pelagicum TaxID=869886 RepID=A0A7D5P8A2_9EURY|nr:hypothetical protein [Halosimplex pelagicum]QLH83397.1 hypothetical protein HZS54_17940 [Halosimplex pelagicum]